MLKNQLLQQALTKIEEGVKNRDAYDRIVKAGAKVVYNKETFHQLSEGIAESETPVEDVAKGMVSVIAMMSQKAKGTIPQDALLQAGMAMMIDALDFMEQAGLIQVDKSTLDTATTEFLEALLPTVGLPAGKLGEVLSQVQTSMADPQKRAMYQGAAK